MGRLDALAGSRAAFSGGSRPRRPLAVQEYPGGVAVDAHPDRHPGDDLMIVATISTVKRAVWLLVLCLYAAAAAADIAAHLISDSRAGQSWHDPAHLAVASSARLLSPA